MRFALSDDQALLRSATRDFVKNAYPFENSRRVMEESPHAYAADDWRRFADMGYLGLTVPVEAGGQGLGAVELAIVMEELGHACVPGPFLDACLAATALAAAGNQPALLGDLTAGTRLAVLARADTPFAGSAGNPTRVAGGRARGTKHFVPFAAEAAALLVTTPDGLHLVDGPFDVTPLPTLDPGQRFGSVRLDHAATLLGPPALLEPVDRLGAVGAGAMLLGLMSRALEMTVAYSQTRQAFKRPIGSFQALQHRMADMLLRVESTRAAVYRAAWCIDTADAEVALACATAKAYAGDAARHVCGEAIQMHGGIGFTWELDLHFFFKRAKTLEQHYGSTEEQLGRALAAAGF